MAADSYISNVVQYGHYNDTETIYGVVRDTAKKARDVANGAWDTYDGADMGDYDISAATASGGLWSGDFPVEAVNGHYIYQFRVRAGGSPATGDEVVYNLKGYWNGAQFLTAVDVVTVVGAAPITLAQINAECDTAISDANLNLLAVSGTTRDDNTAATTTVIYTELSETTADHYNNMTMLSTSGATLGQARRITDYSHDATDGIITVYPAFTEAPDDNSTFVIIPPYFFMPLAGALEITYTVKKDDEDTGDPIDGVEVWITTDAGGTNVIWSGTTNSSGVLKETTGDSKPFLDAGTYYFWRRKSGYSFSNPDTETFS